MQAPLEIRVVDAIASIPAAAWDSLLDAEASPFLEHAFIRALEETGCAVPEQGWTPRHLTAWRGERLVGAAPAYVKDHSHGEFVFDFAWAAAAERMGLRYYPKLVLAVPFTPAAGRRVLVAPDEERARLERSLLEAAIALTREERLSSAHLLFPTPDEASRLQRPFSLRHGIQFQWRNEGYGTLDDFLARFSAKRRAAIRREMRAPGEQGLTIESLEGDALGALDPLRVHALYRTTIDKLPWGRAYLTPGFFERALTELRHVLEVTVARRGGALVAGALNFQRAGVLYGRYWGAFEEHPFLHFNVCVYHPVARCIRQGFSRFEPGAGGDHKLTRGFLPTVTYSGHFIADPTLSEAVEGFLDAEREAVARALPEWSRDAGFKSAPRTLTAPAGDTHES